MKLQLKNISFPPSKEALEALPNGNLLINTINAHSYNVAHADKQFAEALLGSDVLLPDGISVVLAKRFLSNERIKKIAGEDLFYWEMNRLQTIENRQLTTENVVRQSFSSNQYPKALPAATVLFLGSSETVLAKIKTRAAVEFPNVQVHTYSPPFKAEFSDEDNAAMVEIINALEPDVLFVGMTAPKQEKWAWKMVNDKRLMINENDRLKARADELTINHYPLTINNCHICCIGAVFDFYAGTVERAPMWWQKNGLEWLYRLLKEPRRMWRRYLIGNVKFVWYMLGEKVRKT